MGSVIAKDYELVNGVDWVSGHTIMVWGAYKGVDARSTLQSMSLREFLDALNITAEDCQKAFEEWEE